MPHSERANTAAFLEEAYNYIEGLQVQLLTPGTAAASCHGYHLALVQHDFVPWFLSGHCS